MHTFNNKKTRRNKYPVKRWSKKKRTRKHKPKTQRRNYKGGAIFNNSFRQNYRQNLGKIQQAIEKFSGKHAIDANIAAQFVHDQLSDVRKQAAQDLIDNTIYITLQEVSEIVEQLIVKLYAEHDLNSADDFYFFTGSPAKSFYFLAVLALYCIKKHNFKEPTQFVSELSDDVFDHVGNSPIIILDDVSYSGSQLSNMLGDIYYHRVIKVKRSAPNILVLLVALNTFSKRKLSRVPILKTRSGIAYDFAVSPFKLIFLAERLYTPLILTLGIERYFYLNVFFSIHTENNPFMSLYLDHKIADDASTYTNALMYGPIVPSSFNYAELFGEIETYHILPDKSLFELDELNALVRDFNETFGININTSISENELAIKLSEKLCAKLIEIESDIRQSNANQLQFKPFINTCNKSAELLKNASDLEIVNFDYVLFLPESDCLLGNRKCNLGNGAMVSYLGDKVESVQNAVRINAKINSISCPFSWYKSGRLRIV